MAEIPTFHDLIESAPTNLHPIMHQLQAFILEIHPDVICVTRLGDRATTFGVGPKKMSEGYCYIMPQKSWVNLGFYQGAHIADPLKLLEGTGKNLRHIKCKSDFLDNKQAIQILIKAALNERRQAIKPA